MGNAGLDLCVDILLDLVPLLRLRGRVLGDQRAQEARLDVWDDSSLWDGVEVANDWEGLANGSWVNCVSVVELSVAYCHRWPSEPPFGIGCGPFCELERTVYTQA